ncbi:MBL fold metallo-hydrolase [Phytomonospora sp. NPDC050363]|uniref:MBL fold metallo-hydrolase n=1 Tax=Phytomonospora sp. NPDC050363 TaxID=3155642 RepID=UPI0033E6B150
MVINFGGEPLAPSPLDVHWIHGTARGSGRTDPPLQTYAHDPFTYILRQSKDVTHEAPFLYLFCGNDRALLLDTGDVADPAVCPVRGAVDEIIDAHLAAHPREGYELIVAHTHGHGDHVAGDPQFEGRPATTIVGREPDKVADFFGFTSWPEEVVGYDLGGRVLEIVGIPGHHRASIAVFDPHSGFLVTGDTVYRGRLCVDDFPAFTDSLDRLVDFAATRPVSHVMGCHIEMTRRPGRDYPIGSPYQPREPELEMPVAHLTEIRDAALSVAELPGAHVFDDFAIFNGLAMDERHRQDRRLQWERIRRNFGMRP